VVDGPVATRKKVHAYIDKYIAQKEARLEEEHLQHIQTLEDQNKKHIAGLQEMIRRNEEERQKEVDTARARVTQANEENTKLQSDLEQARSQLDEAHQKISELQSKLDGTQKAWQKFAVDYKTFSEAM
jgi:chromosome segregation ATPase